LLPIVDTRAFFIYFGLPTVFLMLCMTAVGWVSSVTKRKFVQKLFKWATRWGALGCFVAMSLAVTSWVMNTDFVYSHASIVWPFCLSLVALDGHPSVRVGLLLVCLMGIMNGLYYALIAACTWKIIQLLPKKSRLE
jgi:hypothetical protein